MPVKNFTPGIGGWIRWSVLAITFGMAGVQQARAATSCSGESCALECSPTLPVATSVLVDGNQFPAGAQIPLGLVDPNDGRDRKFIFTKEGAVLVWRGSTDSILPTFFLDLRSSTGGPVRSVSSEQGLLAMVMDPDYARNGLFYMFYTRDDEGTGTQGDIVIERYQRSAADPDVATPDSAHRILVLEHSSASNHNGGDMAFGPDGFLYVSTGDGGAGCDSNEGAAGDGQSKDTLHGKMLRIDVRGIDPEAGSPDSCMAVGTIPDYTVPSSNPYFGDEDACDEVFTLGLRNPFRFSFDRLTGDMYIADVGQRRWEEINLLPATATEAYNFGWVCREGCETSATSPSSCSTVGCPVDAGTSCEFPRSSGGFYDPVLCHSNTVSGNAGNWESIIGGYVYRGSRVPSIAGDYFYGDNNCGQVWKSTTLDPASPATVTSECWSSGFGGLVAFAEDRLGELYLIQADGTISCVHNGDGCPWAYVGNDVFKDGFENMVEETTIWTDDQSSNPER